MKKAGEIIGGIVGILAGLLVLALAGLYFYPGTIINSKSLRMVAARVFPKGSVPQWKDAEIGIESFGFLKKRVSISFKDLCLQVESASADGCFKSVQASAVLGLESWKFRIFDIGPVQLLGGTVHVQTGNRPSERSAAPQPQTGTGWNWGQFFRQTRVHGIAVGIDRIEVKGPGADWSGSLNLVEIRGGAPAPPLAPFPVLRLTARADQTIRREKSQVALQGRFALLQPRGEAGGPPPELRIDHELAFKYFTHGKSLELQEHGLWGVNRLTVNLTGSALGLVDEVPVIRVRDCGIDSGSHRLKLDCPLETGLKSGPGIGTITASLVGRVATEGLIPSFSKPAQSSLELQASAEGLKLVGSWDGKVSTGGVDGGYRVQLNTDSLRTAARRVFRGLELPAPFEVLDGPLVATSQGTLASGGPWLFQADTRLNLRSKSQRWVAEATAQGNIQAGRSALKGDLILRDALLELPGIDYAHLPRLSSDSRIHVPEKKKSGTRSRFKYAIKLRTLADHPLVLATHLAPEGVPLALNLDLSSDAPVKGTIDVAGFSVEAFRRHAKIDHFRLTLADPIEESVIEGKLLVHYTEYTIQAGVFGTVGRPQVQLSSDPPMPEEKIISVLVFGVPFEDLDTDQESSVASTQSALADRVMGLASLYALGSTPVERIGYDPGTGTASIRIRVARGTSVTVRSRSEETDVGLRKRIGANWVISTDFTSTNRQTADGSLPSSQANVASTFLEWNHRY